MVKKLEELLSKFNEVPEDDFDPEKHIHDLRNEIDSIAWRIDKWRADAKAEAARAAEFHKLWVQPTLNKQKALNAAADYWEDFVFKQMLLNGWDELSGDIKRAKIQEHHEASLEIETPATAHNYLLYPAYMKQEITYSWLKDVIKKDSKEILDPDTGKASGYTIPIPGATMKHKKRVEFLKAKRGK